MLVELDVVDQRTKAVYEVLDGVDVVEVAKRYGVCRQTVHTWLRKYANSGFSALVDVRVRFMLDTVAPVAARHSPARFRYLGDTGSGDIETGHIVTLATEELGAWLGLTTSSPAFPCTRSLRRRTRDERFLPRVRLS